VGSNSCGRKTEKKDSNYRKVNTQSQPPVAKDYLQNNIKSSQRKKIKKYSKNEQKIFKTPKEHTKTKLNSNIKDTVSVHRNRGC
jgi:hypothetical protein